MRYTHSTNNPAWYTLHVLTEDADSLAYDTSSGVGPITAGDYIGGQYPDKVYIQAARVASLRASGHIVD